MLAFLCGAILSQAAPSADVAVEERALDALFQEAQARAEVWHYSWLAIFTTQIGVRVGIGAAVGDREDFWAQVVGSVPPLAGNVYALVQPIAHLEARERARNIEALYGLDAAGRLKAKRALAHQLADEERRAAGWLPRLVGGLLNVGAAAGIYALTEEATPALIQVGVGLLVNELKLQTAPRTARSDRRAALGLHETISLAPFWGGAQVRFRF